MEKRPELGLALPLASNYPMMQAADCPNGLSKMGQTETSRSCFEAVYLNSKTQIVFDNMSINNLYADINTEKGLLAAILINKSQELMDYGQVQADSGHVS